MRKIAVITGSRAEYGLLKPLLYEIKNDRNLELQLIVTGSHHAKELGLTRKEIENDGFDYTPILILPKYYGTGRGVSEAMGNALKKYPRVHEELESHIVVLLGDRYEMLAFAASATAQNIPIAHIHGGELTEGSFDDSFRHAITKMSHLHFTAAEEYRKRVIQLGEHPDRVFNVGAIGLDNIGKMKLLSKEMLEKAIGFKFSKKNLLATFHPVTLERDSDRQFKVLLDVLNELPDTGIIFTRANADPGGDVINRMIDDYVAKHPHVSVVVASMGQLHYLSAMQYVDAVVGNSSSGIIEAPSFKIGTINIGNRQKGRIKAKSVIDCEPTRKRIREAFERLYEKDFQTSLISTINPHGDGKSAERIKKIVKTCNVTNILEKQFYDIDFEF